MVTRIDFVSGLSPEHPKKKPERLTLYSKYPNQSIDSDVDEVVHMNRATPRKNSDKNITTIEDGLYVSATGPLTYDIIKPCQPNQLRTIDMQVMPKTSKKLLEIAIREVKIHSDNSSQSIVTSVSILYKDKVICKISSPFNRKLYKLLVKNTIESSNNLSLRVQTRDNSSSKLPLPLPTRCVKDRNIEIDFSINTSTGLTYSGSLICTVTLSMRNNSNEQSMNNYNPTAHLHKLTNDPNDPQNSLSLMRRRKIIDKKSINYFLLHDPALQLNDTNIQPLIVNNNGKIPPPNIVVLEQPRSSLWDFTFGNWLQARRPFRPSSATSALKIRGGRDEVLTITILRGVGIPVREDTGTVQPLVQIKWGDTVNCTTAVDGSTPVWQQTHHFGIPKGDTELGVKLSLFDQHPTWGLQWLGEAIIPLESHSNYQVIERWIGLSSLCSPVHRFGYIPNKSTINSHNTRIYVLMKMKRLVNDEACEKNSLDTLSKAIQRCMVIPYKINGTDNSDDAAKLAMLLTPLPTRYGPLNPRQALKLNKVDYYGRAALLATLLQGLGIDAYVVVGTSQARKWAAFAFALYGKTTSEIRIWDPENGGDEFSLNDSRCPLIKITRLINHQNVWKNIQKATVLSNLKFNLKHAKDWQPLGQVSGPIATTSTTPRDAQILDLGIPTDIIDDNERIEIENDLRDKLSLCRSKMGFTTVFNRHAVSVLRKFLTNLANPMGSESSSGKNLMKQLHRAYHVRGFVLNLRYMSRDDLIDLFLSTRIQEITGAIEFGLVCDVQRYVGKTLSLWLAVVVLRSRD